MSKKLLEIHPDDILRGLSDWIDYAMPALGTPVSIEKFPTGQSNPTLQNNARDWQTNEVLRASQATTRNHLEISPCRRSRIW